MIKVHLAGIWQASRSIKKSKVTGNPCLRLFRKQPDESPVYLILDSRKHKQGKRASDFLIAKPVSAAINTTGTATDYNYISSLYPADEIGVDFTFDYDGDYYAITSYISQDDGNLMYIIQKVEDDLFSAELIKHIINTAHDDRY